MDSYASPSSNIDCCHLCTHDDRLWPDTCPSQINGHVRRRRPRNPRRHSTPVSNNTPWGKSPVNLQMSTRHCKNCIVIFLAICALLHLPRCHADAIKWLSLSSALPSGPPPKASPATASDMDMTTSGPKSLCDKLSATLVGKQLQFCKKHPEFMQSVASGASKAVNECQFQFRTRRWNCSALNVASYQQPTQPTWLQQPLKKGKRSSSNLTDLLNSALDGQDEEKLDDGLDFKVTGMKQMKSMVGKYPIVPAGTRESAFVHAISAAGVAHAVTKACSSGNSPDCGCDRSLSQRSQNDVIPAALRENLYGGHGGQHNDITTTFKWAGCSDNIDYGVSLSRSFVDARDLQLSRRRGSNKTAKAMMNLHNNEAGRRIIMRHMKIDCKCHGVSGSCEIKTCWRVMPNFRQIGEILHEKFERAYHVEEKKIGARKGLQVRNGHQITPHSETDLVYIRRSPDFCEFDVRKGSLGTKGRVCNKQSSTAVDACSQLCCYRGYSTQKIKKTERCKCKFQWCCSVSCQECVREVEIHTCN